MQNQENMHEENDSEESFNEEEEEHQNQDGKNNDDKSNENFTLIINGTEFLLEKKLAMELSQPIRDYLDEDEKNDTFSIEIQEAESYENLIPIIFSENRIPIDKYNHSFLTNFSEILQLSELHSKVENFKANLKFLKESPELKDIIECEKLVFSIEETNLEEKITEAVTFLNSINLNEFNFVRALYFASIANPDKVTLIFDFMARLESLDIQLFKKYSQLPLNAFKRSKTPSIYLENCNEVSFVLLKLIEYDVIQDTDLTSLRICLPYIFSHINDENWVKFLQSSIICKNYFNTNFDELSKDDWKLHKKLAYEGNDPNPIVNVIMMDDFDTFQNISSLTNFNFRQEIKMTFYIKTSFLKNPTLIEIAAFYSAIKIFKFLLMNDVPVTSNLSEFAVAGGNFEIIHICEDYNCDFKSTLPVAIRFHRNDILNWLIESKGALEFYPVPNVLWESCARYGNYTAMRKLLKFGLNPSALLNELICFRQPDVAEIILKLKEVDVNFPDDDTKGTPLHFACRRKMDQIVKTLLSFDNIDVNAKAAYDTSPIHSACRSRNFDVVKLLLDRDDIDIENCKTKPPNKNQELSAINAAAKHGNTLIVKMLVSHPACDINCRNFVLFCFIFFNSVFFFNFLWNFNDLKF